MASAGDDADNSQDFSQAREHAGFAPAIEVSVEHFSQARERPGFAWREEKAPMRDLYPGILYASLIFYQARRKNCRGAVKMFSRCLPYPDPFLLQA